MSSFCSTGKITSPEDLKNICFGLSTDSVTKWCSVPVKSNLGFGTIPESCTPVDGSDLKTTSSANIIMVPPTVVAYTYPDSTTASSAYSNAAIGSYYFSNNILIPERSSETQIPYNAEENWELFSYDEDLFTNNCANSRNPRPIYSGVSVNNKNFDVCGTMFNNSDLAATYNAPQQGQIPSIPSPTLRIPPGAPDAAALETWIWIFLISGIVVIFLIVLIAALIGLGVFSAGKTVYQGFEQLAVAPASQQVPMQQFNPSVTGGYPGMNPSATIQYPGMNPPVPTQYPGMNPPQAQGIPYPTGYAPPIQVSVPGANLNIFGQGVV